MERIIKHLCIILFLMVSNAALSCDINPDAQHKCSPGLMTMYPQVISKWQEDSKNENSVLNSSYWLKSPDCLSIIPVPHWCRSIRDVTVSITKLPGVQVLKNTYAATLLACSGASGSSCHLYHRVYLIVESTNNKGILEYVICSNVSCP